MKKKVIISILAGIIIFSFHLSFAQQTAQFKPAPQQKPAEKFVQKAAPPQPGQKTQTIDANMLQRLRTPLSRQTLINTLMNNQATRTVLEASARNAKMQVNELSTKGLDRKMISAQPQGKTIDQLNWNAGIKISMTKNKPIFFDPGVNKEFPLGEIVINSVVLSSTTAPELLSQDIFIVEALPPRCNLVLRLNVPSTVSPSGSTLYMIALQGPLRSESDMIVWDSGGPKKVNFFPLNTGQGSVGMTTLSPSGGLCNIGVYVKGADLYFSSFTITRL